MLQELQVGGHGTHTPGCFLAFSVPDVSWPELGALITRSIDQMVSEAALFDILAGAMKFTGWQAQLVASQVVRL